MDENYTDAAGGATTMWVPLDWDWSRPWAFLVHLPPGPRVSADMVAIATQISERGAPWVCVYDEAALSFAVLTREEAFLLCHLIAAAGDDW